MSIEFYVFEFFIPVNYNQSKTILKDNGELRYEFID